MIVNNTEQYSEILFEDDFRSMYITTESKGLNFYCRDEREGDVADYIIPWSEVPEFISNLTEVVEKWKPESE